MSMTNDMVCHAWFHNDRGVGENGKGTIYFHNGEIYSYGNHFMMARIFMLPEPVGAFDRIVVRTTRSYSITTSAHQGRVNSAIDRNIAFVADVDDAATVKTLEQALEALVNTAFDRLDSFENIAKKNAWFNENGLIEIATMTRNMQLMFNTRWPNHPLLPEVARLITKTHDPEYIARIRESAAEAQAVRERKHKEAARRKALKYIRPIIAGNAHMFEDDVVIATLMQNYEGAEHITDEMCKAIDVAAKNYLQRCYSNIREIQRAIRFLNTDEFARWRSPFTGSMDNLRALNFLRGQKPLDGAIVDLYDTCLEGAKARYLGDFVDGGLKGDSRFESLLHAMFGLTTDDILLYAWGGERPEMRPEPQHNSNAGSCPNCIVWRTADGKRIRTSMGVEIGLHEFKRFCRIIRGLRSGKLHLNDVPEDLRRVQGTYTVHSYDHVVGLVTVGCHRIAMNNLVALADLVCDTEA